MSEEQHHKKRKIEEASKSSDVRLLGEGNIESILFDGMTEVNGNLISLVNNAKLADSSYYVNNNGVLDEFIGNVNVYLNRLEFYRRKASSDRLNSDTLSHMYQFLDMTTLKQCCFVSKLWRQSVRGLHVVLREHNVDNLLHNSSIVKNISKLVFYGKTDEAFKSLSKCRNLDGLKSLDFSAMSENALDCLKQDVMPNLTELILTAIDEFAETATRELFHSNFMSKIKKLDFSVSEFSNNFFALISQSKYLTQITHLDLGDLQNANRNDEVLEDIGLSAFLEDKVNLEWLDMCCCRFTFPKLSTGIFKNLSYLNISEFSFVSNQDFADLISPNLPKLQTLKAESLNNSDEEWNEQDQQVAKFHPNFKSSLTHLDIRFCKLYAFPSLIDHCPKLKKLKIYPFCDKSLTVLLNMMKSPNLSNLEYLDISCCPATLEVIFTSPVYSNLKHLDIGIYQSANETTSYVLQTDMVSKCTNLFNLTFLDVSNMKLAPFCANEIKTNPIFSNLKKLELPNTKKSERSYRHYR